MPITAYNKYKYKSLVNALMEYLSVSQFAKKWNLSDRSVRNYCANGRIEGAILKGKIWFIPSQAVKPKRENSKYKTDSELLCVLREQKDVRLKGGIYHKTQIAFTYNSNHIEGSRLTEEQTRYIFETNTIGKTNESIAVDDVIETANHFRCVDFIIDKAKEPLTESIIKKLHFMLKSGTSLSRKDWFNIGKYKKIPNEVGGKETTLPENVSKEIKSLLAVYNNKAQKTVEDIISFHQKFEEIHPFQDGNGRVGRLVMFKECLANNIVPFIIDEEHKLFYYRGLNEWQRERGFLIETCFSCQDKYKAWLRYFKISYR